MVSLYDSNISRIFYMFPFFHFFIFPFFFHVSGHFRAPPRTPFWVKIRFFGLKPCPFNEDSPKLSIWRIGQLWKELEPFVWNWSFFCSKFACRRLADRHAAARISDASWTFSKIPSLGGPREQYQVRTPIFRHLGSLGAFL